MGLSQLRTLEAARHLQRRDHETPALPIRLVEAMCGDHWNSLVGRSVGGTLKGNNRGYVGFRVRV